MSAVLTFLGAAGTVAGSKTLVEHDRRRALVDCGLSQGERQWRWLDSEPFRVPASSIEDVVLTHTHLDHCGFSVHADELLGWLHELPSPPESVFVTHGEPSSAQALASRIRTELDAAVVVPRLGERVRLD